ncbi:MAG: hypothetical protein IAI49_07225 [Candidatus Eremiobacteraeota bacterium]|nr:hypothetical protein [Candidatus Eremiobacteraeota bacterium]
MNSAVLRLAPRRESLQSALAAFRAADVDRCLAILDRYDGAEADALRARCLVRAGRPDDALSLLTKIDASALSHRAASELLILRFMAAIAAGEDDVAESAMLDAKVRSYGVGSNELESELHFYTATFAWTQGRYSDATSELSLLIAHETTIPSWLVEKSNTYAFNRGYWLARAYELLAMTAALEGNFAGQASLLLRAFEEYDRAQCVDIRIEASMLSNLAVLVRDLQTPELAVFIRERTESLSWNEWLDEYRFLVWRALGWCSALSGDHLGGLRQFRASAEIAPTKPQRIAALLDRAFIAGQLDEKFFAQEELELACRLTKEVDWENSPRSDRMVLLEVARSLVGVDVQLARRLLDKYFSLRSSFSSLEAYAKDRRRRGEECMAIAAVVRAEGQLDRATMLFEEAYRIWSAIGYAWRAATVALELFTLTGEATYLDVVAREADARPLSWIAKRYAAVALEDPKAYVRGRP